MSGSAPICTACVSRRYGTTCGPGSSRPPAWTGPTCWRSRLNKRQRLAAELLASDAYGSTAERVKAFVQQGGGCRATFFNYQRKFVSGKGTR